MRNISICNKVGSIFFVLLILALPSCQSRKYSENLDAVESTDKQIISRNNYVPMNSEEQPNVNESYSKIKEKGFLSTIGNPLSTFSIDVDGASYSNTRRFIENRQLPPRDAIRVEEFINYFPYDYPEPKGEHPIAFTAEVSECPWNNSHKLAHIGLQGKRIDFDDIPAMNLVFLIDVSGSMSDPNKLPLLKDALRLLIERLRDEDKISMVVYAGAAGLVLPPTLGSDKEEIIEALDNLEAGGSTAGGEGINLAYKIAKENFIKNGNNRIILASDGDFNVGVASDGEMEQLVENKRKEGVYLTVLGFGMGNYKDSKLEAMADNGNGNYFYIDNIGEAEKVLVTQLGGTIYTIAKDVKLQVEFNPLKVKSYRLVGYENRMLSKEEFNDDLKDAGEMGAGHSVTALYEIELASDKNNKVDAGLKYQEAKIKKEAYSTNDLFTIKFRYKAPKDTESKLFVKTVSDESIPLSETSDNFRFSAAAASLGMLLRDSKYKGDIDYAKVIELAKSAKGKDEEGYRSDFVALVKEARDIQKDLPEGE